MTEFTQDPVERNLFRENEKSLAGVEPLPEVGGEDHIQWLEQQAALDAQDPPATGPDAPKPFKRDLTITVSQIGEPLRGKVIDMVRNLLVGYSVEVSE